MVQGVSDKMSKVVQSIISAQDQVVRQNRAAASSGSPNADIPATQQKSVSVDDAAVQNAVNSINREADRLDAKISLSVDQDLNRVLIRFKDPQSGEIIKQIPADAVLVMLKRLNELKGTMFDSQG